MLIKVHDAYRIVVAVCDKELFGKQFREGKKKIDLDGKFFEGEEKTKEEIIDILLNLRKEDATFNFVGEKACKTALELNLINKNGIIRIENVPIALVLV